MSGQKPPGKRQRVELDFNSVKFRRKDGWLSVEPYPYVHRTYAKQRWLGRPLIDVYTDEFVGKDRDYYEKCIEDERIQVNGKAVSSAYVIDDNDLVSHECIFTENPVLDKPIEVVSETDDLLVVSKPSSIPIHACGVYRYLTVVALLQREGRTHPLHTLHRLDRLTSGLVLLAKNTGAAKRATELFCQRKVRKTYLCRVRGDFRKCTADKFAVSIDDTGVTVRGYVRCIDNQVGKQVLEEQEGGGGKLAGTLFQFDSYDEETDESIVRAYPTTGRTHQIRVHLQHVGFPIANDPNYGPSTTEASNQAQSKTVPPERKEEAPTAHCVSIYLHAWRYSSDEWDFRTNRPEWAIFSTTTALEEQEKEEKDQKETIAEEQEKEKKDQKETIAEEQKKEEKEERKNE